MLYHVGDSSRHPNQTAPQVAGRATPRLCRSNQDEVHATELHVVAWARKRAGGSGQWLPGMPSSEKGTTCRTITSLGSASKAMATSSSQLCWSLPECKVSSSRGCLFYMARSEDHEDHHSSEDIGCVARVVCHSWHSRADAWLQIMADSPLQRNSRPSPRETESVTLRLHLTIQPQMAGQSNLSKS